ncbi:hypothetical protein [Dyella mobilis]|uniref:Uncharacterized protein n=1 Tax=Dyella mobilis TaxID=1849582 RepID=A0ABS2KBQ5_9GAMM|nr:hypothetical protein [Dyella mobilis]MBM7128245.1 hypothetical protein [Dyella mobilis]
MDVYTAIPAMAVPDKHDYHHDQHPHPPIHCPHSPKDGLRMLLLKVLLPYRPSPRP